MYINISNLFEHHFLREFIAEAEMRLSRHLLVVMMKSLSLRPVQHHLLDARYLRLLIFNSLLDLFKYSCHSHKPRWFVMFDVVD